VKEINGGGKKMGTDGVIVKQKRRENPFLNLGFNIFTVNYHKYIDGD
jgi:hypothetical protein